MPGTQAHAAAWHDHAPPEQVAVWPAGQLAGGELVQAEHALVKPPGEYVPAAHGMQPTPDTMNEFAAHDTYQDEMPHVLGDVAAGIGDRSVGLMKQ